MFLLKSKTMLWPSVRGAGVTSLDNTTPIADTPPNR